MTAAVAALAVAVELPALSQLPARVLASCAGWITLAFVLELLSIAGFAAMFKLVFADSMSWRRSAIGALRALGASGLLPAGGLVGPVTAAASIDSRRPRGGGLVRSATAFVILTNAPAVVVLVTIGTLVSLGWISGPHDLARSLVPAAIGAALIPVALLLSPNVNRSRPRRSRISERIATRCGLSAIRDGIGEARSLLRSLDCKLLGAVAYVAFDNAVLWAAFRAGGHSPEISVVVMGYVVGSLGSAVPIPGGFGAVEGGLIGALALYGAPAGQAATAVLLYRAVTLLLSAVLGSTAWGTAAMTYRPRPFPRNRPHEQGATPCLPTSSH